MATPQHSRKMRSAKWCNYRKLMRVDEHTQNYMSGQGRKKNKELKNGRKEWLELGGNDGQSWQHLWKKTYDAFPHVWSLNTFEMLNQCESIGNRQKIWGWCILKWASEVILKFNNIWFSATVATAALLLLLLCSCWCERMCVHWSERMADETWTRKDAEDLLSPLFKHNLAPWSAHCDFYCWSFNRGWPELSLLCK